MRRRTIWTEDNKDRDDTLYVDKREREPGFAGQEGRTYGVDPDEIQDFRDLEYDDETFNLVVFDPPHVIKDGGMESLSGYIEKNYGALCAETWQSDIRAGFEELWRVLAPGGTLAFKFADNAADWGEVLDLAPVEPLFGTTNKQRNGVETRWFLFYKEEQQ
ncbi:putative methyltransferase [environmental Halophage eHP-11]|nr:putative methyltransferase [environmental Halophage eHP-11]